MDAAKAGLRDSRKIIRQRKRPGQAVAPFGRIKNKILRNDLIGDDVGIVKRPQAFTTRNIS
ncbi:hypothetical protein W02_03820 [Nitrospira sp. KM1]|nr:hypothetical protein W02_03820 [Nitrospira sp. KM1]